MRTTDFRTNIRIREPGGTYETSVHEVIVSAEVRLGSPFHGDDPPLVDNLVVLLDETDITNKLPAQIIDQLMEEAVDHAQETAMGGDEA
jgi:hypothetical protein